MGFLRGSLAVFLYTLLFVSFLAMSGLLTLSSSLDYQNVKDKIAPLIYGLDDKNSAISNSFGINQVNFSDVTKDNIAKMKAHCTNYTDYVFDYQGQTISVSCDTLKNGGPAAVLNETIAGFIESVYYRNYECGFWNCFNDNELPLFLVSQKARDYWHQKFYFSLLASAILFGLLLLISENRRNTPIVAGAFLSLSALPLLKISDLLSKLLGPPTSLFLDIFFNKADMVFWILFLSGIALIGIGIALKVMNIDFVKHLIEKKDDLKDAMVSAKDSMMPKKNQSGKKKKK